MSIQARLLFVAFLASCSSSGGTDGGAIDSHVTPMLDSGTSDAGPGTDSGPAADAGPTTAACSEYCDCYMMRCAAFVAVPGGGSCTAFCATFTQEQYDCRLNMCRNSNGPIKDNNDHCEHMVGINECL